MVKKNNSIPYKVDSSKVHNLDTVVPNNKKYQTTEAGNYIKIGAVCNLKHERSLPKYYKILINIERKIDTSLYLNIFYNRTTMCINGVNRLQEDLLTAYQSTKRHS